MARHRESIIRGAMMLTLLLTLPSARTGAQDRLSLSEAGKIIVRPALNPVSSFEKPQGRYPIDTIETGSRGLGIILYADNSWEYWRDPSSLLKDSVFSEHWVHSGSDPYRVDLSDMPDKSYIYLVDSTMHYHFPCASNRVTSTYGRRHGRFHRGIDIGTPRGTEVYASSEGRVRIAKYVSGYGQLVAIRHYNGLETFYGHLSRTDVKEDDWVSCGQVIGLSGSTGRSTGPHLHYEVRYMGYAIDPQWLIDFPNEQLRHGVFVLKKKQLLADCRYEPENDYYDDEIAEADEKDRLEAERIAAEMKAAVYHKIKSGDTLSGIARRYDTSVGAICRLNGISTKTTLKIGRSIRVR